MAPGCGTVSMIWWVDAQCTVSHLVIAGALLLFAVLLEGRAMQGPSARAHTAGTACIAWHNAVFQSALTHHY